MTGVRPGRLCVDDGCGRSGHLHPSSNLARAITYSATHPLVVRYWDAFAWPVGYAMLAVDHTLQWACCFHHEDVIAFGTNAGPLRD